MVDKKISELPEVTSVGSGDVVPVVVDDNGLITSKIQVQNFLLPIGSIISWHKSLSGTPALPSNYVECNGQTLNDADSPYNGQVIPDLNGENRFLRGSSTSGDVSSTGLHSHIWGVASTGGGGRTIDTAGNSSSPDPVIRQSYDSSGSIGNFGLSNFNRLRFLGGESAFTSKDESIPKHMTIVWIMKIK